MIARQLSRRALLAVFAASLLVRVLALVVAGPTLRADGIGFVESAYALLVGGPSALAALPLEHAPLYSVFLAALLLVAPVDVAWTATLVQALIGAATATILARLTARETGSRLAGLCAGGVAAVQITFVFWTTYVLSETLFLFMLALSADRVLLVARSSHPGRSALLVGLLALVTIAARPTGVAFMAVLFLVLIAVQRSTGQPLKRLVVGFWAPMCLLVLVGIFGGSLLGSSQPLRVASQVGDWVRSGVQNGLLETEQGRATAGVDLDVQPPPIVDTLSPEQRTEFVEIGPFAFAAHHVDFVLVQAARKLRMFWSPVLPEYSRAHALLSGLDFYALYAFAVFGLVSAHRLKPLLTLCVSSVLLFTLTSLITIVDYDQRYRLPAELFLVPLAGIGLAALVERATAHGLLRQLPERSSPRRLVG